MEIKQIYKERSYWPTNSWNVSQSEIQGLDSDKLSESIEYLSENFSNYRNLLIIKNGYVVFESHNKLPYENLNSLILRKIMSITTKLFRTPGETFNEKHGESHNIRSATKSIMSILLGIALDKQLISSIDEKIYKFLPDYDFESDNIKKEITIRHLITMKSGLTSIESDLNALKMLCSNGDWVKYILNLPLESKPGEKFAYNSANMHLLSAIISNSAKMSTYDFANKFLFQPLGIKNTYWEEDKKGYNFGGGNLFMSPYDMAKIGYLYLNNGIWDGDDIISKSWIEESLKSYHEWVYGYHYGYLWYIRNEKNQDSGKEFITYSASGAGGQKIYLIPELDIVVVATSRTSLTNDKSYFLDNIISKFIIPATKI